MKIEEMRDKILRRLGDTAEDIWTAAEIEVYCKAGYNQVAMGTEAIWDVDYLPDWASWFNYTAEFEYDDGFLEDQPYLEDIRASFDHTGAWELSDLYATGNQGNFTADFESIYCMGAGPCQYTAAWELTYNYVVDFTRSRIIGLVLSRAQFTFFDERDYINNQPGPANFTTLWEYSVGYMSVPIVRATSELPDDLYRIERSTWDAERIGPVTSVELERSATRYEITSGRVEAYLRDKDGLNTIRKWRVPTEPYVPWDSTGMWGILRDPTDLSTEEVRGSWGVPRRIPGQHVFGGRGFGLARRVEQESNNMRLEFSRRGLAWTTYDDFELPTRYAVYAMHYALAQALKRDGPGMDVKLSAHYAQRFAEDVGRARLRCQIQPNSQRVGRMGGAAVRHGRPPKPKLPWAYGRVVR